MRKYGIGYRITASLVITALLTAALSVMLLFGLTQKAFYDYVNETRIRQGQEISGFLGDIYTRYGWEGVRTFVENTSSRQGQRWTEPRQGPGSMRGAPMRGSLQRHIIVTDTAGEVRASSESMDLGSRVAKDLWDIRVPIFSQNEVVGYLIVSGYLKPSERNLEAVFGHTITRYSFLSAFAGLCIALVMGFLISRQLVRPIKKLSQTVRLFAQGDRNVRCLTEGDDELAALAADFNSMADKIKSDEELRRNLTADVAHELRTPVSIIRGTLDSIQTGALELTPGILLSLQDEIIRLSRLIKDLSDLSQTEAGVLELNRVKMHPTELKEKFSYFRAEAEARGIDFIVDIPENLPEIDVDVIRITQVISNLLNNALRHTTSGKIVLSAKLAGGGVIFSVKDTGRGIKKEDIPYIFERFYRAEKSRSRRTGGMGLGLTISKGLIEAHGGKMWVESEEGKGTEFFFLIPLSGNNQ